ncbi:type VI secretion system-associated FHA domain protein TagH [Thiocapsa sp. UBA6158]|jgi:type VI secretion system FHA domain protein|uniref:type VI secretion system-associated FHA domain protein TagH n=1 Tax=Thiocapsa sp. UBA6158 TaxID=1947692 RepID=UPI0025F6F18E|nr:type VI secretion system-associated FHA domain protein TagH [Thiocapsa sp. UBA6158]
MELILRLIDGRGDGGAPTALRMTSGAATIGRARDNDMVLDDPERVVSGRHALIEVRDSGVWITDTSRNGTFLNQATEPLPTHQPMSLHNGDRLAIGAYELLVSIASSTPETAAGDRDPFDDIAGSALPGLSKPGPRTDILDLLNAGGGAEPRIDSLDAATPHLSDDPFADASPLDSRLAAGRKEAPPRGVSHQTPVENVYFRPPEIQAIPDNYDILNDVWAAPPEGEAHNDKSASRSPPGPPEPLAKSFEPQGPARSAPAFEEDPFSRADPLASATNPSPMQVPRADVRSISAAQPLGQEARSSDTAALVDAFIEGLGVGKGVRVDQPEELMRNAGRLLRALAAGLTLTMMGRAQFKSELHLGVTTIRPAQNNPFKFSADPDDLLDRLLFRPSPGFLPAVPAAREAFDDIRAHEMAMTAGLQAALRALLARFEPAELERRLTARSRFEEMLPMVRKSRYWDLFTEAYKEVAADAAEDFMRLFGDAFTKAYQEQIQRLDQARSPQQG